MVNNAFSSVSSLVEYLERGPESCFPAANGKKTYVDRFKELDRCFSDFPVEMGAMKSEIDNWRKT